MSAYYIWSEQKKAWKSPRYSGYTLDVMDATVYTRKEANKNCNACGQDLIVAVDDDSMIQNLKNDALKVS